MSNYNNRIYYIYLITNNLNHKNYVGQRLCPVNKTIDNDKYMGSGVRLHWAYDKYGMENFSKEILAVCSSKEIVDILEKQYIALYRSVGKAEYNVADGGLGLDSTSSVWKENQKRVINSEKWKLSRKKVMESEEYHQKLRDGQRRRWSSEKARKECGEKSKRSWQDPEVRKRHIEKAKGRVFSDESKRKIGDTNRKIMLSKHLHWYTNGIKDVLVHECPEGYWLGKSKTIKGMKKKPMSEEQKQYYHDKYIGVVWWNNGVDELRSKKQPEGFVRGRLPNNKKCHWYTNGKENIMCDICPEGFHLGRVVPKNTRKLYWYTNGIINTRAERCPEGFWKGMIHKPLTEEHKRKLSESHKKH